MRISNISKKIFSQFTWILPRILLSLCKMCHTMCGEWLLKSHYSNSLCFHISCCSIHQNFDCKFTESSLYQWWSGLLKQEFEEFHKFDVSPMKFQHRRCLAFSFFFAISHCKSAYDRIGSTVKRSVARASLKSTTRKHLYTLKDHFMWLRTNIHGIYFIRVSKNQF